MYLDKNTQFYPDLVEPEVTRSELCGDKDVFAVRISGGEYVQCECGDYTCYGARQSTTEYQKGHLNTQDDPRKVDRMGKLMECAIAKVFPGQSVDFQKRENGDKKDFDFLGMAVDCKCAGLSSAMRSGLNYIVATNKYGREIPVDKDIYIGGYLAKDDRSQKEAIVVIAGWMIKDQVEKLTVISSPVKTMHHKNREMKFVDLNSIQLLRDIYLSRLGLAKRRAS